MKKIVSAILILSFCFIMQIVVFADSDNPSSASNATIVIEGTIKTYSIPPLMLEGRLFLPLRETLVDLGVKDDSQHIQWNPSYSSITIVKDTTTVVLKISDNKAIINGHEEFVDVPPFINSSRTYIPLRFISQALGKKVVWNSKQKIAAIRDSKEFEKNSKVFEKIRNAMDSFKTLSAKLSVDENAGSATNVLVSFDLDRDNKKYLTNIVEKDSDGKIKKEQLLILGNKYYSYDYDKSKWLESHSEFDGLGKFEDTFSSKKLFDFSDIASACAFITSSDSEIQIKSNIMLNQTLSDTSDPFSSIKKIDFLMGVDPKSYYVNMIKAAATNTSEGKDSSFELILNKYDTELNIPIPKESDIIKYTGNNSEYYREMDPQAVLKLAISAYIAESNDRRLQHIKAASANELITSLQGITTIIDSKGNPQKFGPYLEIHSEDGNPSASYYKPILSDTPFWKIIIDPNNIKVTVSPDATDSITILENNDLSTNSISLSNPKIQIVQDGKRFDVTKENEDIPLKKESFSIRFNLKKYDEVNKQFNAACIAALQNKELFDEFKGGIPTSNSAFFAPGSGMATFKSHLYDCLIITDNAFHYLYYENGSNRSVNLLEEKADNVNRLEWEIDKLTLLDNSRDIINIPDAPVKELFLIIFIDKDLDNIIESGEFSKVHIKF